jgi:hypothetical protein
MNRLESGTHDIVVLKISPGLDAALKNDMADRLMQCIPMENPVLLVIDPEKFNFDNNARRFRRPSFTFIILNFSDLVSVNYSRETRTKILSDSEND